jgi:hypothetical protein
MCARVSSAVIRALGDMRLSGLRAERDVRDFLVALSADGLASDRIPTPVARYGRSHCFLVAGYRVEVEELRTPQAGHAQCFLAFAAVSPAEQANELFIIG